MTMCYCDGRVGHYDGRVGHFDGATGHCDVIMCHCDGTVGHCDRTKYQYANTEHNKFIHKRVMFPSYEDPLGMALALIAFCFSAFTAVVLCVFVKHHDTPIVKANNRILSYLLLLSLMFCFLCSFFFIGHPN